MREKKRGREGRHMQMVVEDSSRRCGNDHHYEAV